jgi:hypothetical protein
LTFSNPDFAATDTLIRDTKKVAMSLDNWILNNLPDQKLIAKRQKTADMIRLSKA